MSKDYNNFYDMIIIGGGPSGLSSAIYMARAKYKTLVLEKEKFGGQITITSEIVNYPGVFKTSGKELTQSMQKQAQAFNAEFKLAEVLELDLENEIKTVKTTTGEYKALSVVLALGASPRKLGFNGEEKFAGRGVAYCATCDAEFFTDMPVYVIGGGFAAVEEAMFLSKYAKTVKLIVREETFSCAKTISDNLKNYDNITAVFNTEVKEITGENNPTVISLINNQTNENYQEEHPNGFGLFVFAGYEPNTKWLTDKIEKERDYIVTDSNKKTNIDGVYAAGDVCIKELRQVVTAVSDGAIAATSAEKYVAKLHTKLNIPEFEIKQQEVKHEEIKKEQTSTTEEETDDFLTNEIKEQLKQVFEKFENKVIIKGNINNSDLGKEMSLFLNEMSNISNKIIIEKVETQDEKAYLELFYEDKTPANIKFNMMPGGHEFNSFIIALYNVAGPGKEITAEEITNINKINEKTNVKVVISLTCTLCPELVIAMSKVATLNKNIDLEIMDIAHNQNLKEKYNIMSVPCIIIDDKNTYFGKKNINQMVELIAK